jgi:hypothetical protein
VSLEVSGRAGCLNIRVGGFLAVIVIIGVAIFYLVHGVSGSAQVNGPSCAVTGAGGVVMVVTADHESPNSFCRSTVGNVGDLSQEGPWRAGGSPSGSPACTASLAGLNLTLYDPQNTGDGANDCTVLQEDGWQVVFGQ